MKSPTYLTIHRTILSLLPTAGWHDAVQLIRNLRVCERMMTVEANKAIQPQPASEP